MMRRKRPKFLRYVLLIVGVALFILIFFGGSSGLFRIISLERKKKALTEEVAELKVKMEILNLKKARLEQDLRYIEKIARERFGMVRADSTQNQ
jgi:cell division protein FtsB